MLMPKTCLKCRKHVKLNSQFIECTEFNWKIHISVAKEQAVCRDNDKHHVFPEGRIVPIKLYQKRKVTL